ncbi:nitrogen fixation protein NifZ [Clostridium botulinum]|uniref:nitrogen fixation protein NifZ n=1 Tax=Clostridium botulinum TaxID=1491 RepID=UPI001C9A60F9|nr:nitrogen fixation protein NifZ [Clostridium botulinum]MBY6838738.1 hypothetical protein [Clostridium botulinum]
MKFNKNDRVKVIKDITNSYDDVLGETGTIKAISCTDNKNYVYFIDCDNNVGGWSNNQLNIKDGHGISCLEEEIELIK